MLAPDLTSGERNVLRFVSTHEPSGRSDEAFNVATLADMRAGVIGVDELPNGIVRAERRGLIENIVAEDGR